MIIKHPQLALLGDPLAGSQGTSLHVEWIRREWTQDPGERAEA